MPLSSERLFLRPLHLGDAHTLWQLLSTSQYNDSPAFHWARHFAMQDSQAFIAHRRQPVHPGMQGSVGFAVVAKRTMAFLGVLDMQCDTPHTHTAELGIWIKDAARGCGLAAEACQMICQKAHDLWGWRRLIWQHHVSNEASAKLAARLGFSVVGALSELAPDHVCYQKLLVGSSFAPAS